MIELNSLNNERNFETTQKMSDDFVNGIITSPPYNIGKNPNHRRLDQEDYNLYLGDVDNLTKEEYLDIRVNEFCEFDRVLKQEGVICYNMSYSKESPSLPFRLIDRLEDETNLILADVLYWKKQKSQPFQTSSNKLSRLVEPIFIIVHKDFLHTFQANKEVSKINERTGQKFYKNYYNIIEAKNNDGVKTKLKATFSTDLVEKIMNIYFPEGSIIYDPFMGIGTTAKACVLNNRKFVGSELVREFFEDSIKQLKELKL